MDGTIDKMVANKPKQPDTENSTDSSPEKNDSSPETTDSVDAEVLGKEVDLESEEFESNTKGNVERNKN